MTGSERGVLILLGLPDYLAWRVCALLLREPAVRIAAFVAGDERQRAERAARELARIVPDAARLTLREWVPGAGDLGLSAEAAVACAEARAIVDLTPPGAPCEPSLPASAPDSLALVARCPNLQRFDFLSSAFVAGDRQGIVVEDDFARGQGFNNPWEEQLYRRESAVRAARLPCPPTIYRPTFLVGDSRSGEIGRFGAAYEPLRLIERLHDAGLAIPMIGRGEGAAPIVPVDFVAAAIARGLNTPAARGRTFHLADPDAPTIFSAYRRAVILLTGRGPAFGLSPRLATRLLRSRPLARWDISPGMVAYLRQRVSYGTRNTFELLQGTGIAPPSFVEYSAAVIGFFADHCDDPRFGARLA